MKRWLSLFSALALTVVMCIGMGITLPVSAETYVPEEGQKVFVVDFSKLAADPKDSPTRIMYNPLGDGTTYDGQTNTYKITCKYYVDTTESSFNVKFGMVNWTNNWQIGTLTKTNQIADFSHTLTMNGSWHTLCLGMTTAGLTLTQQNAKLYIWDLSVTMEGSPINLLNIDDDAYMLADTNGWKGPNGWMGYGVGLAGRSEASIQDLIDAPFFGGSGDGEEGGEEGGESTASPTLVIDFDKITTSTPNNYYISNILEVGDVNPGKIKVSFDYYYDTNADDTLYVALWNLSRDHMNAGAFSIIGQRATFSQTFDVTKTGDLLLTIGSSTSSDRYLSQGSGKLYLWNMSVTIVGDETGTDYLAQDAYRYEDPASYLVPGANINYHYNYTTGWMTFVYRSSNQSDWLYFGTIDDLPSAGGESGGETPAPPDAGEEVTDPMMVIDLTKNPITPDRTGAFNNNTERPYLGLFNYISGAQAAGKNITFSFNYYYDAADDVPAAAIGFEFGGNAGNKTLDEYRKEATFTTTIIGQTNDFWVKFGVNADGGTDLFKYFSLTQREAKLYVWNFSVTVGDSDVNVLDDAYEYATEGTTWYYNGWMGYAFASSHLADYFYFTSTEELPSRQSELDPNTQVFKLDLSAVQNKNWFPTTASGDSANDCNNAISNWVATTQKVDGVVTQDSAWRDPTGKTVTFSFKYYLDAPMGTAPFKAGVGYTGSYEVVSSVELSAVREIAVARVSATLTKNNLCLHINNLPEVDGVLYMWDIKVVLEGSKINLLDVDGDAYKVSTRDYHQASSDGWQISWKTFPRSLSRVNGDGVTRAEATTMGNSHFHSIYKYEPDEGGHRAYCSCGEDLEIEPHAFNVNQVLPAALKAAATATTPAVYYKTCGACGVVGSGDAATFTVSEIEHTHKVEMEKGNAVLNCDEAGTLKTLLTINNVSATALRFYFDMSTNFDGTTETITVGGKTYTVKDIRALVSTNNYIESLGLTVNDLTLDLLNNTRVLDVDITKFRSEVYDEENGTKSYNFTVLLANIKQDAVAVDVCARAYFVCVDEDGNYVQVYSNTEYTNALEMYNEAVNDAQSSGAANPFASNVQTWITHRHDYQNVVSPSVLKEAATHAHGNIYYKTCTGAGCNCGKVSTLFAFDDGNNVPHSWKNVESDATFKSDATCTSPKLYYKSCDCGVISNVETFTVGATLEHNHRGEVQSAAALKEGTLGSSNAIYYKTCTYCGMPSTNEDDAYLPRMIVINLNNVTDDLKSLVNLTDLKRELDFTGKNVTFSFRYKYDVPAGSAGFKVALGTGPKTFTATQTCTTIGQETQVSVNVANFGGKTVYTIIDALPKLNGKLYIWDVRLTVAGETYNYFDYDNDAYKATNASGTDPSYNAVGWFRNSADYPKALFSYSDFFWVPTRIVGATPGVVEAPESFKFLLMSDTHVEDDFKHSTGSGVPMYTMWEDDHQALKATYQYVNKNFKDLEFGLFLGDSLNEAYNHSRPNWDIQIDNYYESLRYLDLFKNTANKDMSEFFVDFNRSTSAYGPALPESAIITIQGNHDNCETDFYRDFSFIIGNEQIGKVKFIGFFAEYPGTIYDYTIPFVEQEMAEAESEGIDYLVLMCHYSVVDDYRLPDSANRTKILELANKYGCSLYLSGHTHDDNWSLYDVAGTSMKNLSVGSTTSSWSVAEIKNGQLIVDIYSTAVYDKATGLITKEPQFIETITVPLIPRAQLAAN